MIDLIDSKRTVAWIITNLHRDIRDWQKGRNLQRINRMLPVESMIKLPAFITNDYIDRTLDLLEERLNSRGNSKVDANYWV